MLYAISMFYRQFTQPKWLKSYVQGYPRIEQEREILNCRYCGLTVSSVAILLSIFGAEMYTHLRPGVFSSEHILNFT